MKIDIDDKIIEPIIAAGYRLVGIGPVQYGGQYWSFTSRRARTWGMKVESHTPFCLIEPKYIEREPTQDDLANGPIKCWVRDGGDHSWEERELLAIIPKSMGVVYRFLVRHPSSTLVSFHWKFCKIRVPAEEH